MKQRILTGVKPTGTPHIGNYFGAIQPAIMLANSGKYDSYLFIADYHALTTVKDATEFKELTYQVAATWLACGLDPDKTVFYRQSDVPEIFELNWLLSTIAPKGLMNRAHAYKAAVDQALADGHDPDAYVNMGLYTYPILMAADILAMQANYVPVGQDQKQHVEIARDLAGIFNKTFGDVFTLPEDFIPKGVGTIVGLDGRKMSKSYGNTIELFSDAETLRKQIMRIVTDSSLPTDPKPLHHATFTLFSLFANPEEVKEMEKLFMGGIGWGDIKKKVFELFNERLSSMRDNYNYFITHKNEVDEILAKGAVRARVEASKTLEKVRKLVGK